VATNVSVGQSQQPVEVIAQTSPPQSLHMAMEENAVPEGKSPHTPPPDVTDASEAADSKSQIAQFLEGSMSEILRSEDAIDVMTDVLLTAAKIRIQAGKFGFEMITIGTTTIVAEIRKYTEKSLVELPFEVVTQKITKTGAGCAGISLVSRSAGWRSKCVLGLGRCQRKCREWPV
jgi:hypothetical protein